MTQLFTPLDLRALTLKNRLVVAPMCQYSARRGVAQDYHLVHYGRFALGGFGLVLVEATAVVPEGRISYADLGLWDDAQIAPLARIAGLLKANGASAGIQLAHAGRKASATVPWRGGFTETEAEKPEIGFETWVPVAPSAEPHAPDSPVFQVPHALTTAEIAGLVDAFAAAARRAEAAGFDVVEVHGAHGYLINQFLSPLANKRTDRYGGGRDNRMRFALEVVRAVRAVWPAQKPLLLRLSVTDSHPDGWTVADSIALVTAMKEIGVDAIDCSSGGFDGAVNAPGPLYQVALARAVREGADVPTAAVGLITRAVEAEAIVADGDADLVALAREALDDPNWPLHARASLVGTDYSDWPKQSGYAIRNKDRALGLRGFGAGR
jgi:2,4-dienoyl-CoA reductase-like NADH-dependent reductase (Old Yellow Enzyme family)